MQLGERKNEEGILLDIFIDCVILLLCDVYRYTGSIGWDYYFLFFRLTGRTNWMEEVQHNKHPRNERGGINVPGVNTANKVSTSM